MLKIIITIGWSYVVILMAATQTGWIATLGTLLFYGILPLGILLYLIDTPARARRRRAREHGAVSGSVDPDQ